MGLMGESQETLSYRLQVDSDTDGRENLMA